MHLIGRSFWSFLTLFICICITYCRCQSNIGIYDNGLSRDSDPFTTERNRDSIVCMDIYPQRAMDMDQIMGKWYGNEIIIHSQDVPGVFQFDSCVVIEIADLTDQMHNRFYNDYRRTATSQQYDSGRSQQQHQYELQQRQHGQHRQQPDQNLEIGIRRQPPKYLRLLWSERDDTLEYIFNYTSDSPGRWTNVGEQRGSLAALNHYTQFSGTVQVAKAVNDHLVLTFCGNDMKSTIYTIVLSRQPQGLSPQELYSIRTLLSNRRLSVDTIRKICSSGATPLKATFMTALVVLVLSACIFRK